MGAQGSPLAAAFKKAGLGEENADFAFFQDYPCLFQKPRSPEEDALFKQGLSMLHVWYGHEQNVCWQQTELPAGFAAEMEALGLARSYEESGWCFVEAAVSAGVKVGTRRLDLGKRTDDAMTTYGGRGIAFPHWKLEVVCAAKRQPPLLPDEVRQLLETEKKFTTGKEDVEVVDALYRGFFEGVAGAATVLTFKGLQWGAAEVKALAGVLPRFSVLQTLDLSDNKLGGEGASELAGWLRGGASLTSLILSHNNIKGSGEALGEALKANTSLKKLEMSNCALDAEDGKGLAGGLAVHAPLTSLSVRGNNIKGSGAAFGEALKVNSSLKELNMRACSLEADDGKGLAGGLAIHASLTELNLMENKLCSLGDIGRGTYDATGITALAGALGVCVSLTSISLLGNKFDDEAALMLLKIKEEKPMLLTLCGLKPEQTEANFYGLDMGPAEAKLLAPELAVHPSLRSVSLAANQLCGLDNLGRGTYDATGIKALADALSVTASLTSVSLVGNQLCGLDVRGRGTYDATGIKALADALSVTASLTSLKVGDNRLGDEGKAALRKAVEGKEGFELLM